MQMSKSYAKALFDLGTEKNCSEEYLNELELASEIFSKSPDYLVFLSSLGIPLEERLESLDKAFSKDFSEEVVSFFKLLCEKRHIGLVQECIADYKCIFDTVNRIKTARVVSAFELSENEKTALKEKLEQISKSKIILECIIDKSVVGGISVELDGSLINWTISRRLKEIKEVINK